MSSNDYVSRQKLITAMKRWYWDNNIQSSKDDPCVIDAMTDLAIRTVNDIPASDVLEFSQEEKQVIWDALYRYHYLVYELSQSDHFAKDAFEKEYHECVNLMKRMDEKWNIIH